MGKKANKRKQKQQNNQRGYATSNNSTNKPNNAAQQQQQQQQQRTTTTSKTKKNNNNVGPTNTTTTTTTSTTTSTNKKSSFTFSSQNHQDLLQLLGALVDDEDHHNNNNNNSATTTTTISPDRFYKKLYNIHDTLNQLGISYDNIQKVVVALGYDITIETSLDWLCLHLKASELPPLFTEGTVRMYDHEQDSNNNNSGGDGVGVTVLKPTITTSTKKEEEEEQLLSPKGNFPPPFLNTTNESSTKSDANTDNNNEEEKEDDDAAAKAWILQQYQYDDDDDDDDDEPSKQNHINDQQQQKQQQQQQAPNQEDTSTNNMNEESTATTTTTTTNTVMSPSEKRLMELEDQLKLEEADAYDDASNYMRSKHEIKQLQNNVKKLRKQVQNLQKRVDKERQQAAAAAAEAAAIVVDENKNNTANQDDDNDNMLYGGGFFGGGGEDEDYYDEEGGGGGFFDTTPAPAPSPAATTTTKSKKEEDDDEPPPPKEDPVVPKDSIPSGWTGKTPIQILEDWCKKEKLRRPQFFKLSTNNGARIKVETTTRGNPKQQKAGGVPTAAAVAATIIIMETDNYMGSYKDAQQYLATKVLYEVNTDLPLYRLFPPYYRELWLSWKESVQYAIHSQQQEEDEALRLKIQQLVDAVKEKVSASVVPQKPTTTTTTKEANNHATTTAKTVAEAEEEEGTVLDSWEDDDDDDENTSFVVANNVTRDERQMSNSKQATRNAAASSFIVMSTTSGCGGGGTGTGTTSQKGQAMKEEFQRRKESPAYQSMLEARSALPMFAFREQILETIQKSAVTILCAETGAGKTTQCPQFILEDGLTKGLGDETSVICTQPRRVAATSVAERVSDEMAEPILGQTVGYQIRLEAKRSANTRLLFCTTGVIMRRLQDDPTLKNISHICVDEVHERQYQVDCLLVILRKLLRTSRPDLKVILMSATLDAKLFSSFFGGAPVVNVPGRTFPVATYHLEDLLDETNTIIEEDTRYAIRNIHGRGTTASIEISTRGGEKRKEVHSLESSGVHLADVSEDYLGYKMTTRRSMDRVNEEVINYDLIQDILHLLLVEPDLNETLLPPEGASLEDGSVLVFLPGFGEIRSLTERLEASRSLGNKARFDIIPMHSTLSPQDQRRAFLKPKKGCRKIILSTNIAETSVTISDVVIVVDVGRVREVRVDKRTSTSKLVTDWCSKASAKQRAGRAGRVQPGLCLKLYSSKTATVTMHAASQPEIRRVPLEDVCISILAGSFANNCMEFLNQAPQPPAEEAVRSALRILHDVGAITFASDERRGVTRNHSEQLTPLGHHLARLPVDVRLGKMLIFGCLFKVVDPVLTVAASLSCKSPFSSFVNDALQAKAKHKLFAHDQSDFLTLCNVWEAYDTAASEGMSKARKFCYDNYLSFSALREIGDTRRHFMELLCGIGFLSKELGEGKRKHPTQALLSSPYNANKNNFDVVHSVICAGLYPNVGHLVPNESGSGERKLWHKNEQLHFHSSSVNSALKATHRYPTSWIAFHEKFGTQHRVSVSTTCFVHPFAILIFGGEMVVQHTNRKVVVDAWIELPVAAQTGVMFREVRKQIDKLLQGFLQIGSQSRKDDGSQERHQAVVEGVVRLLSTDTS